ncbi:TRAP transporter small permease subunit [Vandammella animalimorsus]|uniref:TRAP transporter small permease protein n=1 Tax=Vandammella animalimorsus TaxID=2029117 RepID=A0A2A2AWQ8_9BURK|nr:TRAP transporter small permease [Vandammella animalimorsus]PAT42187.1 C4-dicarboxylate ABC transporter permease [Vandammella animalimorsus]
MNTTGDFSWLGRALAWARRLSRAAVWVGGALTLLSVALICADVLARRLLGVSMGGADELSGYAFAISVSWALAFTALERANVRVDVLYQRLPLRVAAVADWLALVALGVFAVVLCWYAAQVALASWEMRSSANTPLGTPLVLPQALWAAGLLWFVIVLALMLLRASLALVTGDLALFRAVCGIKSAVEEAGEEAAAGERLVQAELAAAAQKGPQP